MNKEDLAKLKKEYAMSQRYGAHFISASLLIWIFIFIVNLLNISQYSKNAMSLFSSALLVPLALLFSKLYRIKFSDTDNPLNTAGIVFALNQMIYLLVVILVWLVRPEQMITAYAIVVGAHFMPYSWLYNSYVYRIVAIVIPLLSFILALLHQTSMIPLVMIIFDLMMIIVFLQTKKQ